MSPKYQVGQEVIYLSSFTKISSGKIIYVLEDNHTKQHLYDIRVPSSMVVRVKEEDILGEN